MEQLGIRLTAKIFETNIQGKPAPKFHIVPHGDADTIVKTVKLPDAPQDCTRSSLDVAACRLERISKYTTQTEIRLQNKTESKRFMHSQEYNEFPGIDQFFE